MLPHGVKVGKWQLPSQSHSSNMVSVHSNTAALIIHSPESLWCFVSILHQGDSDSISLEPHGAILTNLILWRYVSPKNVTSFFSPFLLKMWPEWIESSAIIPRAPYDFKHGPEEWNTCGCWYTRDALRKKRWLYWNSSVLFQFQSPAILTRTGLSSERTSDRRAHAHKPCRLTKQMLVNIYKLCKWMRQCILLYLE